MNNLFPSLKVFSNRINLIAILVLGFSTAHSQPVPDIPCTSNIFYGAVGNTIHQLQMNANNITDLGVFAPSGLSSIHCVAYGYDIVNNSSNRTLYSSVSTFNSVCAILRYDGTAWDTVATDTVVYHNGGAYGRFIYFQNTSGIADQCISRLNANGTLTKIYSDTTLAFTVADIAVDSSGNIYCFRGPFIGNTTELTVLDSSGTVVNSYSANLNFMTGLYGSMFINGTLYVGWTGGSIFPVVIIGNNATLGAPIPVPTNVFLKDLANCHEITTTGTGEIADGSFWITVYPNAHAGLLELSNLSAGNLFVSVYDVQGRRLLSGNCYPGTNTFDINDWPSGVYLVVAQDTRENLIYKSKFCLQK